MEINMVDTRDMKGKVGRSTDNKSLKKAYIDRGKVYTEEELRRYAGMIIEERIKFCRDVKKVDNVDKCTCESIERWIRLFTNYPIDGSVALGNLKVAMVKKVFEEMKMEGKIKCE